MRISDGSSDVCSSDLTFAETLDEVIDRAAIRRNHWIDDAAQFGRLLVEFEQRLWVNADLAVDDEFEAGEADALVRQRCEIERLFRRADIHHDLDRNVRHLVERDLVDRSDEHTSNSSH